MPDKARKHDEVGRCWCGKNHSEETDTIAATAVRSIGGDELAETLKTIFGNWF